MKCISRNQCNQLSPPRSENFPLCTLPPPPNPCLSCGPIFFFSSTSCYLTLSVYLFTGCLSPLEYKLYVLFATLSQRLEGCSQYWLNERLNQLWSVWKCLGVARVWYVAWIAISRELIFAFTYRCRPCFCDGWESGCRKTHSTSCRKGSWANWREWFSEEGKCSRSVDIYKQVKDRTYASGNRWQMHCPAF